MFTTAGWASNTVGLWNPATGQLAGTIGPIYPALDSSPVFSPRGHTLATGNQDGSKIVLWDTATRQPMATLDHANARPVFSPDGQTLATIGNDGTLRLWDPATGRASAIFDNGIRSDSYIVFSPDSRIIAINNHAGTLWLWDPMTGRLTTRHDVIGSWGMVFSPDSHILAINDYGMLRLLDPATGQITAALDRTNSRYSYHDSYSGYDYNAAFSPDGRTLAAVSWAGKLRLWPIQKP